MNFSKLTEKKVNKMIQEGFLKFVRQKDILFWAAHGSIEEFPKSTILFYQHHFPIGLYILVHGLIEINCSNSRKKWKIPIHKPAMLGLNHLLESTPYNLSAEIISFSKIIFIPRSKLIQIPNLQPQNQLG